MSIKALYFGAEWCGQCKTFRPKFISECEANGIEHGEFDADDDSTVFEAYGIRNIPYVVISENGTAIEKGLAADIIPKLKNYKNK